MAKHEHKTVGLDVNDSPTEGLMNVFMLVSRLLKQSAHAWFANHPVSDKLSGPRMGVLYFVAQEKAIRMRDLAEKMHVTPRTITDLVDGLEKDGFVKRVPDPNDRRATLIELTDSAKENFGAIQAIKTDFIQQIFSVLGDDEKRELTRILLKIKDGPLQELARADAPPCPGSDF